MTAALTGISEILRLIARRDRARLSLWIAVVTAMTVGTAATLERLFASGLASSAIAGLANHPALRALVGPVFDATTTGGLTAWRVTGIGSVLAALMSALTVIRHTRAEEEAGRRELLESGVLGRHAVLAAALLAAWGANLLLAALVGAGLVALGLEVAGAAALGLSFAVAGATFAAIAAVAAQLAATAGVARTMTLMLLGAAYLTRAVGDAGGVTALSWSSPIGWAQRMRAFAGERWWVLALAAVLIGALVALAFRLSSRRDLGSGLLAARPGPPGASRRLSGPFGLAWRLQRGPLLAWCAGLATTAAVLASVAPSVLDFLHGQPRLRIIVAAVGGQRGAVSGFFAMALTVIGGLAAAQAIQAVLRLQVEEDAGRAEPVLAAAVGRVRWAAVHLVFALAGPMLALALAAVAAALVHGLSGGGGPSLDELVLGALIQVPAVWTLAGLALVLHGFVPRFTTAAWGVLVASLLVEHVGPVLRLSPWIRGLSPFAHVGLAPGREVSLAALAALGAVAATLATAGLVGLRRRDIGA